MDHIWLCVLLVLNKLIYCGHTQDHASPVLTLQPNWTQIFMGESVTLLCNMPRGNINDWEYNWRRTYKTGWIDITTKENKYKINAANMSDSGDYTCGCRYRHHQYHSTWSNTVKLTVTALPKASLLVNPKPVYSGETVTLTCSVGSNSDWRYKWYKDRNDNMMFQSGSSNPGVSYTISNASVSDQGQYWCEGHRVSRPTSSQPSTAITLTVLDLPTASVSVSPYGLIYSGEIVTLQCNISEYTDWTYWWYRNDQLQSPGSPSKTITTQSDQVSQYQCQGRRTDRPQSSQLSVSVRISVTVTGPSTSVLVGVFVGLVAAAVLLTIFLVLLCRYKNNKGSSSNISFQPIHPQSTNQDPQQDQGSTQVQSPDAGHTGQQYDTAGVSAGSDDVTYAQIQLKKLDKKKKEFTPLPKSESVYSQIKFFKDLGP